MAAGLVGCGSNEPTVVAPDPDVTIDNALLEELFAEYRLWIDELRVDLAESPSDRLGFAVDGAPATVGLVRCGAEFGDLPPSDDRIAVSGIDGDTLVQLTIVVDDIEDPTGAMFELTLTDLAADDLGTIADYRAGSASAAHDGTTLTIRGGAIGIDETGNPIDVEVTITTSCG